MIPFAWGIAFYFARTLKMGSQPAWVVRDTGEVRGRATRFQFFMVEYWTAVITSLFFALLGGLARMLFAPVGNVILLKIQEWC